MKWAIREAGQSGIDIPIGCIILREDKIIARGHNEVELTQDPTAHAELLCLRRACRALNSKNLSGCILVCTLEPCLMCEEAIKLARISRVIFGAFPKKDAQQKIDWIGGIMESECSHLITEYFHRLRG